MKKHVVSYVQLVGVVLTLIVGFLFVPAFAQAQIDLGIDSLVTPAAEEGGYDTAGTDETTFSATLGRVIRAAISLLGVVFTILIVYGGILWMQARGDEGKVEESQKIIRNAVIGLILTVGSYALANFIVFAVVSSGVNAPTP